MQQILDICFDDKTTIGLQEFMKITEQRSSDMVLAVLSLLRDRLPCSENYWRYKRNYEIHTSKMNVQGQLLQKDSEMSNDSVGKDSSSQVSSSGETKKVVAQAHMSFVKPLSEYNNVDGMLSKKFSGLSSGMLGS